MSARLLAVLILPTLLLALALAPSQAAQQPVEPPKTEKHGKAGKVMLVQKVYQVVDLVTPAISSPDTPPAEHGGCTVKATATGWSPIAAYRKACGEVCPSTAPCPAPNGTLECELITLIKNALAPTIWSDMGGPATLEYFPLTHALVVKAPPDVQEQVMALLEAIRRVVDVQISCEVRFLAVSDCCYERLKSDFGLKDSKDGPMASFDDKKLYTLMEAVQGDPRTNVMQAPKITMFDGQAANIRVSEDRFFTTGLTVKWDGEKINFLPVNEMIPLGFRINLQPQLSSDHRYLDLSLDFERRSLEPPEPTLIPTQLLTKKDPGTGQRVGCLRTFPATNAKPPRVRWNEKELAELKTDDQAVVFTQFIQAPKVNKVSLEQKLVLPAGKTAVLYGWKQTTEVTDAVPVLSKLPVIGKLYQRVRREPETVLVLVTPLVIASEPSEPEVLPMPRPAPGKNLVKQVGYAEPQEAPPSVNDLLAKYHAACGAGKLESARKIAIKALKLDPTCFDKKR